MVAISDDILRAASISEQELRRAEEVKRADWIRAGEVQDVRLVRTLERDLHRGEAEALVLALERDAQCLLPDENAARSVADRLEIPCVGLLGVLGRAKEKGLIPAVAPALDALRTRAGFWMSDALCTHVRQSNGE